jgi:hypothetical protein
VCPATSALLQLFKGNTYFDYKGIGTILSNEMVFSFFAWQRFTSERHFLAAFM